MRSEKVTIGKIISPHGVKGLFKVLIYSENEDSFFSNKRYFKVKNKKIDIIKKFNKGKFIVCGLLRASKSWFWAPGILN